MHCDDSGTVVQKCVALFLGKSLVGAHTVHIAEERIVRLLAGIDVGLDVYPTLAKGFFALCAQFGHRLAKVTHLAHVTHSSYGAMKADHDSIISQSTDKLIHLVCRDFAP